MLMNTVGGGPCQHTRGAKTIGRAVVRICSLAALETQLAKLAENFVSQTAQVRVQCDAVEG